MACLALELFVLGDKWYFPCFSCHRPSFFPGSHNGAKDYMLAWKLFAASQTANEESTKNLPVLNGFKPQLYLLTVGPLLPKQTPHFFTEKKVTLWQCLLSNNSTKLSTLVKCWLELHLTVLISVIMEVILQDAVTMVTRLSFISDQYNCHPVAGIDSKVYIYLHTITHIKTQDFHTSNYYVINGVWLRWALQSW